MFFCCYNLLYGCCLSLYVTVQQLCHCLLQVATDRVQKEFNLLNEKVQKLHHDLEDQIHTNTQLLAENSQKAVELKQKEEEILQVKVLLLS